MQKSNRKKGGIAPEGLTSHTRAEVSGNISILVADADTV